MATQFQAVDRRYSQGCERNLEAASEPQPHSYTRCLSTASQGSARFVMNGILRLPPNLNLTATLAASVQPARAVHVLL
jgi:hypothetical protein